MSPSRGEWHINVGILDNDACTLEMISLMLQYEDCSIRITWTDLTAQRTLERVLLEQNISLSSNADVLILDLALNGISGGDVCRQIRRYDSSIGIIGMSSYLLNEYQQLAAAGAQGLFSKQDAFSSAFTKTIQAVASGECAECSGVLLSEEDSYARLHAVPDDAAGISGGKLEIRCLCARGLPPKKERSALSCIFHAQQCRRTLIMLLENLA